MIDAFAPQPLELHNINFPFVGDWDIDQVFQMELRAGQQPNVAHQFVFGYYDNVQNNFILELRANGETKYFTANAHATLRSLLDLVYGAAAAYEFTEKDVVDGDPLPQDDDELLDLYLEDLSITSMNVTVWGGNFEGAGQALPAQQLPPLLPLPPQEDFDEADNEPAEAEPPAIEQPQPILLPPILPAINQLALYNEDPVSDEEDDGPIS